MSDWPLSYSNDESVVYDLLQNRYGVSRETFDRLRLYHSTLLKWQKRINLISPQTISSSWTRHFIDSAQLISYLPSSVFSLADLGSGAGFPGLVIGLLCPHANVSLIESDQRKSVFLREISRLTALPCTLYTQRIEDMSEKFDLITARGCAELSQLLAWTAPLMKKNTICLFLKGKNYTKEIEEARHSWNFSETVFPSITDPDGVVLSLKNIEKRIT